MNTHFNTNRMAQGVSLIELMVALAVSAIMLLGVGTIYTASKRSYQLNDQFSILQENARYALHRLAKEIRMAGYTGCDTAGIELLTPNSTTASTEFQKLFRTNYVNNDNEDVFDTNFQDYITGHVYINDAWSPALPIHTVDGEVKTVGGTGIQTNTQAITIRKASACSASLSAVLAATGDALIISSNSECGFEANKELLITNCENADLFTATAVGVTANDATTITIEHAATGNTTANLSTTYNTSAFIMEPEVLTFFVSTNTNNGTSLYVNNLGETKELIPDIEDMVIQYGIDTDNDGSLDVIVNADEVTNTALTNTLSVRETPWNRVIIVYLRLLFYTDAIGTKPKPYSFNGVKYDGSANHPLPNDYKLRREFVTAINLRNRIH